MYDQKARDYLVSGLPVHLIRVCLKTYSDNTENAVISDDVQKEHNIFSTFSLLNILFLLNKFIVKFSNFQRMPLEEVHFDIWM